MSASPPIYAKDDPHVPKERSKQFAELTGIKLKTLKCGGAHQFGLHHQKYWTEIDKFFDSDHE